mmetsp:Transcript_5545/g.15908  ORF Transcript_5545/g.15908 Transcript_5545/m.15908 type:complete len:215 (-) Transcript_5545:1155-1799(-)
MDPPCSSACNCLMSIAAWRKSCHQLIREASLSGVNGIALGGSVQRPSLSVLTNTVKHCGLIDLDGGRQPLLHSSHLLRQYGGHVAVGDLSDSCNVGSGNDAWVAPQWIIGLQRLLPRNVQTQAANTTLSKAIRNGIIVQQPTARHVYNEDTTLAGMQERFVHQSLRLGALSACQDNDVRRGQKSQQLLSARPILRHKGLHIRWQGCKAPPPRLP